MKKAALYVRVSTAEQKQHGISVASQIAALEEYCKEHNYIIYKIYNDAGISARKSYKKRPALLEMVSDCQQGNVDIVLFTKLDRFFRSVPDYYACIAQMEKVPWRAIWEDYETETSTGVFKVNIMLSVAQSEADRTSERIKSIMDYKRERHELVSGKLPRGYMIENKRPVKDPEYAEAISAFFTTYCATTSLNKSREAAAAFGYQIGISTASFMLRNAAAYAGSVQGIECEPYITKEQCALIQSQRKSAPRATNHPYKFAGLIYCSCGGRMGSHRAHKHKTPYIYYNCTRHYAGRGCDNTVNIGENDVEKYLISNIDSVVHDYQVEVTDRHKVKESAIVDKQRIEYLKSKRSRLLDAYVDGLISKEDFKKKVEPIESDLARLEPPEDTEEKIVEINQVTKSLVTDWKSIYQKLDDHHKYLFWSRIIKKITVDTDRSISISL